MTEHFYRHIFFQQLDNGYLDKVIDYLTKHPDNLVDLIHILGYDPLGLHVRIGVSAVLEHFAGKPAMTKIIMPLNQLTHHQDTHLRCDACYFLSLTHDSDAKKIIQFMLNDPNNQVKNAAQDALDYLAELS